MTQVLALRKVRAAAGAELERVASRGLQPDEVRIRIRAASVCGTDKHIYNWDAWAQSRIQPPMTFGHEGWSRETLASISSSGSAAPAMVRIPFPGP